MKIPLLAALLLSSTPPASAQTAALMPGATRLSRMPYEIRALEKAASVEKVQWAILHGLLGWEAKYFPTGSIDAAKDEKLLAPLGVEVAPLKDPAQRAALAEKLSELRQRHNLGVRSVNNRGKFLSREQLVLEHRALIAGRSGSLTLGAPRAQAAPVPTPSGKTGEASPEELKRSGRFFDTKEKTPPPSAGSDHDSHAQRATVQNAPRPTARVVLPKPLPQSQPKKKPGLFGLLGEIFKSIGRTISRIAKAVLS